MQMSEPTPEHTWLQKFVGEWTVESRIKEPDDKEVTYRFVDDVVRELAAISPGPYLHAGGDEVAALSDEQYAHFVERVQEIVYAHGKTMVGWEEVGKARLRPTTIAQKWRPDSSLLALEHGAKLLMSPGPRAYVDMKYTPSRRSS